MSDEAKRGDAIPMTEVQRLLSTAQSRIERLEAALGQLEHAASTVRAFDVRNESRSNSLGKAIEAARAALKDDPA